MKWRKLSISFLTLKYGMRMICTELWILLIIANELNSVWWQIGNNLNMGIGILDETQSNYWNLLRISLKCLCWQEKQTNPRHNFKVLDLITHHQDSNNRKIKWLYGGRHQVLSTKTIIFRCTLIYSLSIY